LHNSIIDLLQTSRVTRTGAFLITQAIDLNRASVAFFVFLAAITLSLVEALTVDVLTARITSRAVTPALLTTDMMLLMIERALPECLIARITIGRERPFVKTCASTPIATA
jgi:hypothetical protein